GPALEIAASGLGERGAQIVEAVVECIVREQVLSQRSVALEHQLHESVVRGEPGEPVVGAAALGVLPAFGGAVVEAAAAIERQVIVPERSGEQLTVAVLVEVSTANVRVHVAAELLNDEVVDERGGIRE